MTVCGDVAVEANETFNVNLSNASDSATITDPTGVGTIENDDVSFSIDDVQQLEGQSGTTSFVFTVTKTGTVAGLAGTRTIDYATSSGTATGGLTCPGVDYESTSGSLTFLAADASQTITVTVCGDVAVEANETFNVNLSNASDSATITDPTGVGTIENDDVSFSIDDVQQLEGQSGTTSFVFTVTKTGTVAGLAGTRTIDYATSSGTATGGLTCPGVDYESTSGSLTFLAAEPARRSP